MQFSRLKRFSSIPIRTRTSATLFSTLLLLAPVSIACAVDFSVESLVGTNSNPLTLASRLSPQSANFSTLKLRLKHKFDSGLYARAYTRNESFPDEKRADETLSILDLGYKNSFRQFGETWYYDLSLDATDKDKTYVSHTTGSTGTFSGQSIADRYDYDQVNANAKIYFRTRAKTKYLFQLQQRKKDYADYAISGLSNFDYGQTRLGASGEFRVSTDDRLTIGLAFATRDYDDRRAEDLSGNDIPGTDLSLDYIDYALEYSHRPSDRLRIEAAITLGERKDNQVGAEDATTSELELSLEYELDAVSEIEFTYKTSSLDYANQVFSNDFDAEEEGYAIDGARFSIDYSRILWSDADSNLRFLLALEVADYDSDYAIYQYRQNIVAAGIAYRIR